MSRVVFHRIVVRRVIQIVVQPDVLTSSERLMVGRVMNVFAFDRTSPQIRMMLGMCPLSGMVVRVMIGPEGNTQNPSQVGSLG